MPVIDRSRVPEISGSKYPDPFGEPCRARRVRRLGEAGGLTRLGVSEAVLPPGSWSSQRHWHAEEDEFVIVLEGEVVLVTDAGEDVLRAGDCAAFPAGVQDGHCVQNRSSAPARVLAMSNRSDADWGEYPGLDLVFTAGRYSGKGRYLHRDGTPYPGQAPATHPLPEKPR
jgi:uncharacterized cupin superfamily protein